VGSNKARPGRLPLSWHWGTTGDGKVELPLLDVVFCTDFENSSERAFHLARSKTVMGRGSERGHWEPLSRGNDSWIV